VINDQNYQTFRTMAKEKITDLDLTALDKDRDYLKILLKAEVARTFWGYDEYYRILRLADNQVSEALRYLIEAREMLSVRQ